MASVPVGNSGRWSVHRVGRDRRQWPSCVPEISTAWGPVKSGQRRVDADTSGYGNTASQPTSPPLQTLLVGRCSSNSAHAYVISGADSIGHVGIGNRGHVPPLLQMAGNGGTASRRTTHKKLTELYCPSRKRSPKRLIVLVEPKQWRGTLRRTCAPGPPTFKFVPMLFFSVTSPVSVTQLSTLFPSWLTSCTQRIVPFHQWCK